MSDITVALLRGINVGGHRKLPMAKLRELLTTLGAGDVRTYIQSGNAVFRGALDAGQIAGTIETEMGFDVHVMAMPLEDYAARLAANPFPELTDLAVAESKILHVYFLDGTPAPLTDALLSNARDDERLAIVPGAAYLHAPNGIGRSRLADRLERALGVPATARNWKSARMILGMAQELAE